MNTGTKTVEEGTGERPLEGQEPVLSRSSHGVDPLDWWTVCVLYKRCRVGLAHGLMRRSKRALLHLMMSFLSGAAQGVLSTLLAVAADVD